jgi:hypothetical protein
MILKASQRGGAKQLGFHLLKTEENEHIEIHEVSGFVADDLMGAMKEMESQIDGGRSRLRRASGDRLFCLKCAGGLVPKFRPRSSPE